MNASTPRVHLQVKETVSLVLTAAAWFACAHTGCAAQIDIGLRVIGLDYPVVAIALGDTIKWTVTDGLFSPEFVASYTGEWSSSPLTNAGSQFSYTFNNPGFFAYHTRKCAGTVSVFPCTNKPAPIAINCPTDGLRVAGGDLWMKPLATLGESETNIASVAFMLGTDVWKTITNAPYTFRSELTILGEFTVTAKLLRKDGTTATSAPVRFSVRSGSQGYAVRHLPGGEILMYYVASPPGEPSYMAYKHSLSDSRWSVLDVLLYPPVFVDTSTTAVSSRFYKVWVSEMPPP